MFTVSNSLAENATSIRQGLVTKLQEPLHFVVEGQAYLATHKLGASSAEVFLATDSQGRACAIKKYPSKNGQLEDFWFKVFANEVLKTNALVSAGIATSPILATDPKAGIIVKEYTHGLTLPEIRQAQGALGLTASDVAKLEESLAAEIFRVAEMEGQILPTLRAYVMEPQDIPGVGTVHRIGIFPFDKKIGNFLFDFTRRRWVFFDP